MATTAQEVQAPVIPRPVRRRQGGVVGTLAYSWYLLRRYPVIPGFILSLLVIAAIIGPWFAPYQRDIGTLPDRFLGPFSNGTMDIDPVTGEEVRPFQQKHAWWPDAYYLLGTDQVGRDMFSRLLHGARISMQVVMISLVTGMVVGVSLGISAGYFGGIFDELVTRFVDIWNALPFLMVALVVTLIFGRSITVLFFVLAMIAWAGFVRVLRAQVLVLREMDYVASARVNGASDFRIMFRHLLPGVLNTAIVVATLNTSGLILSESVLSFVGAGIQPPIPAWGTMTNEGRAYLATHPHAVLLPAGAIFLVVMSLNFLGDWLRDRLDPRLRQVN
jgi:ABC-type dipeptide/oligopeptide/nickel transport system permease subunit